MYFVERNRFSLMKYLPWKMSILGNDLKLGDIKQQQRILSPFWSLQNHGVGEAALPPWALEENPVSPLLASSRSPSVLWFVTTLLLSVHGLLCVSVSQISLSFFLQVDLGPAPIPGGSHLEILDVLTSTETIFQIKVQFIDWGFRTWMCLLGKVHNSTYCSG